MSPNARDRARAKRRYAKRQAALEARAATRRQTQQVIGAVIAVIVVAGGVFALAQTMDSGSGSSAAATTTTSAAKATASPAAANPCSPPPAKPAGKPTYKTPPPRSLAKGAVWKATISTSCGPIGVELFGDKAPQTVASFLFLSGKGFYDSSPCHRLTTAGIFVLQCGDPTGSGTGGPGYQYGVENAPADGKYPAGTLAMARSTDPGSNGSQFFLTYQDTDLPTAGGGYTIFGRVTSGLDVLKTVAAGGVAGGGTDGAPARAVSIERVTTSQK